MHHGDGTRERISRISRLKVAGPQADAVPEMTRFKTVGLLLVVAALGPLASCGGGDSDRDAVDDVLSNLETASRDGDGARICSEIFTPKLAASVSRSSDSGKCATEVKAKLFSPNAEIDVEAIDVGDESSATATVKEANGDVSKVFLVKQDGQWRIRGVTPAA
jgi:hypothetical protein